MKPSGEFVLLHADRPLGKDVPSGLHHLAGGEVGVGWGDSPTKNSLEILPIGRCLFLPFPSSPSSILPAPLPLALGTLLRKPNQISMKNRKTVSPPIPDDCVTFLGSLKWAVEILPECLYSFGEMDSVTRMTGHEIGENICGLQTPQGIVSRTDKEFWGWRRLSR